MSSKRSEPGPSLLEHAARTGRFGEAEAAPLADRMRPLRVSEVAGQAHLLGEGKWLRKAIEADQVGSLILWGPPGVGKTTLARVIAGATKRDFVPFSAVLGGVAELRTLIKEASENRRYRGKSTILFIDELHRFNKSQQDALLPHVEDGTVTLIGATTENPSFAVNAAVLSRAKVVRLHGLSPEQIVTLLERAATDPARGLGTSGVTFEPAALLALAEASDGDARRALGMLETAVTTLRAASPEAKAISVRREDLAALTEDRGLLYDRSGEEHYNVVSAFIKSMRGSDPDAAIYWLMRMIEAGEDPLFLLRRLMIFASEDVGNADPRALQVAVSADQAFRRMGLPEGLYPLSQACLYLASCPKSASVGKAFHAAEQLIRQKGALPVPLKLRNAPTALMKVEGYGEGYRYAHDFENHYVPGETYLPEELLGVQLYRPTEQGLEKAIGERLARLRGTDPPDG